MSLLLVFDSEQTEVSFKDSRTEKDVLPTCKDISRELSCFQYTVHAECPNHPQ